MITANVMLKVLFVIAARAQIMTAKSGKANQLKGVLLNTSFFLCFSHAKNQSEKAERFGLMITCKRLQ